MAKPPVLCWGRWCYIFGGRDRPSWVSVVRQEDWSTILLSRANKGTIAVEKTETSERPPHSLNADSLNLVSMGGMQDQLLQLFA